MKKVIVTGATGFIGTYLVKRLASENVEVWAVIYPNDPKKSSINSLRNVHCVECSIEELLQHTDMFPKDADVFYHLAWQGVNAKDRDNMECQIANINMGLQCIKFAAEIDVKKFILPGSTSEYLYYGKPIDEKAIPSPQNAYGSVKVALRYLAQEYARQFGLSFIYTVITGIYAADRRDNNVIFYVIEKLLKKEKPSVTKLEQLWDYVNIRDVVEALVRIGRFGKANTFYTIGHGDNWPLYKYIDIIHNYIDPTAPIGIGEIPYKDDRLPSSCVDLTKIFEDTGFVPKVQFEDEIKKVIDTMASKMVQKHKLQ